MRFQSKSDDAPVNVHLVDMNPICVARSLVLYKMLSLGLSVNSIFEVWYSSCLSE